MMKLLYSALCRGKGKSRIWDIMNLKCTCSLKMSVGSGKDFRLSNVHNMCIKYPLSLQLLLSCLMELALRLSNLCSWAQNQLCLAHKGTECVLRTF